MLIIFLSPLRYATAFALSTPSQSESLISSALRGFFSVSATCSSNSISSQGLSIFSASSLSSSLPIILRRSTKPMPLPLSFASISPFSLSVARFISEASPFSLAAASSSRAFCICSSLNSSAACAIHANGFVFGGSGAFADSNSLFHNFSSDSASVTPITFW